MTGQIPKYGKDFRLEHIAGYDAEFAPRAYVLKANGFWRIRSDHSSERWVISYGALIVSVIFGTLGEAMQSLRIAYAALNALPIESE